MREERKRKSIEEVLSPVICCRHGHKMLLRWLLISFLKMLIWMTKQESTV